MNRTTFGTWNDTTASGKHKGHAETCGCSVCVKRKQRQASQEAERVDVLAMLEALDTE